VKVPLEIRRRHPAFLRAVAADTRITLRMRGEAEPSGSVRLAVSALRLAAVSDASLAMVLYRARAAMRRRRIPVLPPVLHRLSMMISQVCIGDPVVIEPGVYVAHGQIVVDGFTTIEADTVLFPWVTIGLVAGKFDGPTIRRGVWVGTGAKVLGPITVGRRARIGANAVVLRDVPAKAVAVGVPARVVRRSAQTDAPS
jgi:serine O-acetyltransferase